MWVWGCLDADDPALNMASVSQFILEVIENRRSALHASASPSMRFYCWIDALAGQLRFSLVSTAHGRLPFGCQIVETTDIGNIVQLYLNLCLCLPEWVAPVTWDEEEEMNKPFVLSVFAVTLP